MNYALLLTELHDVASPLAAAYSPLLAAGDDRSVVDLLNDAAGLGSGAVAVARMGRTGFLLAFIPAVVVLGASVDAVKKAKWDRYLAHIYAMDVVYLNHPNMTTLLTAAVTDGLLTAAAEAALHIRTGSRGEVLFGPGTAVTLADISFAIRGVR